MKNIRLNNTRFYDGLDFIGREDPGQMGLLGGILASAVCAGGVYYGANHFQEDFGQFIGGVSALCGVAYMGTVLYDFYQMYQDHRKNRIVKE